MCLNNSKITVSPISVRKCEKDLILYLIEYIYKCFFIYVLMLIIYTIVTELTYEEIISVLKYLLRCILIFFIVMLIIHRRHFEKRLSSIFKN
jgi:hypothetical protein